MKTTILTAIKKTALSTLTAGAVVLAASASLTWLLFLEHRPQSAPVSRAVRRAPGIDLSRASALHKGNKSARLESPKSGKSGTPTVARLALALKTAQDEHIRQQVAEELARIGSPSAVKALLQSLAALPDGDLKEEVARLTANVTERKSAAAFLDAIANGGDPAMLRAAQAALSQIADGDIVREINSRYETAANGEEENRLVNILAYAQNSDAVDALMDLASQHVGGANTALADAAIRGLANIGTGPAVSFLVQQLETMPPEQAALVFEALSKVSSPEAHAALFYAAQGNKEATTEQSRSAAILALANYQDEQTSNLLGQLASADDPAISAAAQASLQTMGQVPAMP